MTDTSATATISDLTNPFAGIIDLKDKVGLSLFVKATEGLPKEQKFNLSQETSRKTVEAIKQANQAFSGVMCVLRFKQQKTEMNMIW